MNTEHAKTPIWTQYFGGSILAKYNPGSLKKYCRTHIKDLRNIIYYIH
jgi:hypothetical protein